MTLLQSQHCYLCACHESTRPGFDSQAKNYWQNIQWLFFVVVGNNWGICDDGTGAAGCGPQETFRSCADVAIH